MKNDEAGQNLIRSQQGFFTIVIVTVVLTALIGGATILSMVTSRRPVSGAMDRLDRNQATPEDMETLQNAGRDMERTTRIAAAGGSLIGGGGPVPNPASPVGPGSIFPGDKAVAGIIPRVIGRMTNRASQPAQTGNNPMPGESGGTGSRASAGGEYNPLNDPNISGAGSTAGGQNLDDVNRFGSDFQAQQLGGSGGSDRQTGQQGQTPAQQPDSYTTPGPSRGDTASQDQQGSGYYPPYGPRTDRGGRDSDWTRWASEPDRRSGYDDRRSGGYDRPQSGGSTGSAQQGPTPAGTKGIEVTEVGSAPPGKCRIVSGQLVPVKGYKENISGMTVALTGPVNITATSSASGAFSFTDIPAGDYVISVKQWNYGMTRQNFSAPSGKSVRIVLKGSCPFLYVWTGERYERENDIYSVARMMPQELVVMEKTAAATDPDLVLAETALDRATEKMGRERLYKDIYPVSKGMRPDTDGNYRARIIEQAGEHSFTDHVALLALDHRPGLGASMTREGKAVLYRGLQPAGPFHILNTKTSVPDKTLTSAAHEGQGLYNGEGIELALPVDAFSSGVLLVTWQGFRDGIPAHHTAATGRPMLALQRQSPDGEWKTIDWVYPRDEVQQSAFVLGMKEHGWDGDLKIRLISTSCAEDKFHRIDRIEWAHGVDEAPEVRALPLLSALQADSMDVTQKLSVSDSRYLHLGPEEHVTLIFRGEPVPGGLERSLFFVSEGFYIPMPYIRVAAE